MTSGKNQAEGNREAARQYNKHAEETAKSGSVREKAEAARSTVEGDQAEELKKAEKAGKSKAKS